MSRKLVRLFIVGLLFPFLNFAQNPIVQTMFTADPAPMVYNDTLFVYTTHDEQTTSNFFTMYDWQLFSTTDMVNWTAHGTVASLADFTWANQDNGAWAPQCIERNGKFYLYCPLHGNGVGVLVADSPYGPFSDPLGKRLIDSNHIWDDIDPTVFIDDDGQAYLYWGNPGLSYIKLNEDMISYDRSIGNNGIVALEMTSEAFGERVGGEGNHTTNYEEGPWLFKRNDLFYMVYAAVGIPEYIAYSTAPTATGPWTYKGIIMSTHPGLAFTNHPGIAEYKGNSYFFYHSATLPGGGGFNRSVCVEQFEFNADGTFPEIVPTRQGIVNGVAKVNPYEKVEAETIAWSEGLGIGANGKDVFVTNISNGNYIKVRDVDFGNQGASVFNALVSCGTSPGISTGGSIDIYIDELNGTLIGSLPVSYTGGWHNWVEKSAIINGANGVRDVYFVFKGNTTDNMFRFDSWKFDKKTSEHELIAINAMVDEYKIDIINGYNSSGFHVNALFSDGEQVDITSEVNISFDTDGIISISDGTVHGLSYGEVTATIEYNGLTDNVKIIVKNLESELSVKELHATPNNVEMFNGTSISFSLVAEFFDGHTVDVTDKAKITNPGPQVVAITNGMITAKSLGQVTIVAEYKGELGDAKTTTIVIKVANRNPYSQNEAEDYDDQSGIQTEACTDTGGGLNIGFIENNDWIRFNDLDFGDGAGSFEVRVASGTSGGTIEIRTGSSNGPLVGSCVVTGTGGWQTWQTRSCKVSGLAGLQNIYLVFKGSGGYLFNMNWWKFNPKGTSVNDFTNRSEIKVITVSNEKYLIGLEADDRVTIYNLMGQPIKAFNVTSEQQALERLNGNVIIEVKRNNQPVVFKTVL
jgi:arabinoxylan arabinofuranohydrolase